MTQNNKGRGRWHPVRPQRLPIVTIIPEPLRWRDGSVSPNRAASIVSKSADGKGARK